MCPMLAQLPSNNAMERCSTDSEIHKNCIPLVRLFIVDIFLIILLLQVGWGGGDLNSSSPYKGD